MDFQRVSWVEITLHESSANLHSSDAPLAYFDAIVCDMDLLMLELSNTIPDPTLTVRVPFADGGIPMRIARPRPQGVQITGESGASLRPSLDEF